MSLRIAQVSPLIYTTPPARSGGTERVVHDLTEALVRRGHDVVLFAADDSRTSAELVPCGPAVSSQKGVPPGYPAAREAALLEAVRREADSFDVIHCHTEFMHAPVLGPWRHKTLTTVHWRVDEEDRQGFFRAFPDLAVASISRAQAGDLPDGAHHVGTVHHGLPRSRYTAGSGSGGYVAFLGRLTDQKGPDRAIRAARQAGMPIRIAGNIDVGNPAYFDEQVKPLLGPDAEYIGSVDDAEKEEFLGQASVLAMPIDWPEPFGLVVIEAMACGTPVVATPCGSMPEMIDRSSGLVASEDGFADALRQATGLDRRSVRTAFEERFTDEKMAAGYEGIYHELLAGGETA
jgi:glycosyltransferase involved in cell wall biosynthesis